MIFLFECPMCSQELEEDIGALEQYHDYITDDNEARLDFICPYCEGHIQVAIKCEVTDYADKNLEIFKDLED